MAEAESEGGGAAGVAAEESIESRLRFDHQRDLVRAIAEGRSIGMTDLVRGAAPDTGTLLASVAPGSRVSLPASALTISPPTRAFSSQPRGEAAKASK